MPAIKSEMAVPARTPVVILFAETRGFTHMSEILEPAVVLARASEFFTLAQTAIDRHGGTVRNMLNDTLMASFSGERNAQHAVQAAQDIQREFTEIEDAWARDYGIRAAVAMGLHTGTAVVGAADAPLAGQPLIVGDSVSVAERLLHRARAGEFILSKPVMDALLPTGYALDAEPLPSLEITHREPIQLYGVLRDTRLDFT